MHSHRLFCRYSCGLYNGWDLSKQVESGEAIMAELRENVLEVRRHGDDQESLARYTAFFQDGFSLSASAE